MLSWSYILINDVTQTVDNKYKLEVSNIYGTYFSIPI